MRQAEMVVSVIAITLNAVAGLYGAWHWWRIRSSVWFWRLLRLAQVAVVVQVVALGVRVLSGYRPSGLHVLYDILPLLVSLIAEQLRVGAAQMVLDSRGFASAAEVGALDADEQRVVMMSIVQREIGVMALAAIVNVVLLVRAAGTA
jgi:hypothetical protein